MGVAWRTETSEDPDRIIVFFWMGENRERLSFHRPLFLVEGVMDSALFSRACLEQAQRLEAKWNGEDPLKIDIPEFTI